MTVLLSNNASSVIASSITSSSTTIILAAGQGSEFPSPGSTDYFYATLIDSSNNLEIVKVTARTTDTLTVVRGQDGTSARAYTAGALLELRLVAAVINDLQTVIANPDITGISEKITITASGAGGTVNFDNVTQSVLYYTTNASTNWTLNIRGSSTVTFDSLLSIGETRSITFMATQGATPYYNNAVTIDGVSVTLKWQGGTAPASGNASGIDVYTYAIIKTGNATFTVLASQTKFA
jgi:hypothetical protein